MSVKRHSIELLGILATVFGSFFLNTVILNIGDGYTYEGNRLFCTNLFVFCAWYIVVGFLVSISHPKPSRYNLLFFGVLIATVLILSSHGWTDPDIGFFSKLNSWLIDFAQYIVVIPVFFIVGMFAEKYTCAQSKNT